MECGRTLSCALWVDVPVDELSACACTALLRACERRTRDQMGDATVLHVWRWRHGLECKRGVVPGATKAVAAQRERCAPAAARAAAIVACGYSLWCDAARGVLLLVGNRGAKRRSKNYDTEIL